MAQLAPDLGAYILPGKVSSPTAGITQAMEGERIGLGTVWCSERWETKETGATLGAVSHATSDTAPIIVRRRVSSRVSSRTPSAFHPADRRTSRALAMSKAVAAASLGASGWMGTSSAKALCSGP